jgi:hypothetical protein
LPTAWSVNAPKGQLFWLNPAVLTVAAVVTVGLAGGIAVRAGIMNGRGTNDSRNVGQSTQDVASHAAETTIPAPVNETTITSTPATATAPNPTTMLSPDPVEAPMSNPSDTGKTTEKKSSPSQKSEKPKSSTSKQTDKKPTLSFGTILTFGSWNNTPLDWQILKVDKTKVTLISKYVITAGAFRLDWEAPDATSWLTSDIRTWLNSSFKIETPALILDTNGDALRLLSAAEAKRYFPTQTSRTAQPLPGSSEVSGLNGDAPYQIAGKANWWLSDANGTEVRYVSWEGKVSSQLPLYTTTGIRPVLTISTDDARRLL